MEILYQTDDARDLPLIGGELCTFSVLHKILSQPCEKIVTDHARLLLCHSDRRYPVWVWLAEDAGEAELECLPADARGISRLRLQHCANAGRLCTGAGHARD